MWLTWDEPVLLFCFHCLILVYIYFFCCKYYHLKTKFFECRVWLPFLLVVGVLSVLLFFFFFCCCCCCCYLWRTGEAIFLLSIFTLLLQTRQFSFLQSFWLLFRPWLTWHNFPVNVYIFLSYNTSLNLWITFQCVLYSVTFSHHTFSVIVPTLDRDVTAIL